MPVVKDLVPDMKNFYKQYESIKPWLINDNKPKREHLQSQADREKLDGLIECVLCACICQSKSKYVIHKATAKHRKMSEKQEMIEHSDGETFTCIACKFMCKYKSEYERHLTTDKHIRVTHSNALFKKQADALMPYSCICGKVYAPCISFDNKKSITSKLPPKHDAVNTELYVFVVYATTSG